MSGIFGSRKFLVAGERDVILTSNLVDIAGVATAAAEGVTSGGRLSTHALAAYWNPSGSAIERGRTPNQMRALNGRLADGGAIWSPAAGLKVRFMGYALVVASNSIQAVAGLVTIQITDNGGNWTTGTGARCPSHNVFIPAAAGPIGPPLLSIVVNFPGNGYLSSGINQIVTLGLIGGPLTGGGIDCYAWGTEE